MCWLTCRAVVTSVVLQLWQRQQMSDHFHECYSSWLSASRSGVVVHRRQLRLTPSTTNNTHVHVGLRNLPFIILQSDTHYCHWNVNLKALTQGRTDCISIAAHIIQNDFLTSSTLFYFILLFICLSSFTIIFDCSKSWYFLFLFYLTTFSIKINYQSVCVR